LVVDPEEHFRGTILIVAPHMDDEALACGGLIALLDDPARVHIVYATDGMKSPSPIIPWRDEITPDLGEIRVRESAVAVGMLGVPEENLAFLRLPEARLTEHEAALMDRLREHVRRIRPDHILIPFRYDRHPDHLAVHRALREARRHEGSVAVVTEYFVYYRWRLLPGGDVRSYVRPEHLMEVDTRAVAARKRSSLVCFASQTTVFYSWQTRPILTARLLDEVSTTPELFVRCDDSVRGTDVFSRARLWVSIVHRLEPVLQRWKYRSGAFLRRSVR
jgi:LmbE family N-acetylglucosaminyl deacetylase